MNVPSIRRLLVIADVGGEHARHLGDEAMLEANLDNLRKLIPGVALTLVSRDPVWAAATYGVEAVAPIGFSSHPSGAPERRAMLDRLLTDLPRGRSWHGAIEALAQSDGLVVSGGGNLSSTWPDLLYERAALLHVAHMLGKPAVVLGQTVGPHLRDDERRLLAETLSSARFVGLREMPSAALVLALGVPRERTWYQCDDAMWLDGLCESAERAADSRAPSIAITIDPGIRASSEALFGAIALQMRELSDATSATLVLIPHTSRQTGDSAPSDVTEARLLADRIGLPHTVVAEGLTPCQARRITAEAALVISTRYHPIVFGLAAGVPCLGIYGDEYCRIKLQGALAHAALESWTITRADAAGGALVTRAVELWQVRHDVQRLIRARHEVWREESRQRWMAVLRALDPSATIAPEPASTIFGRPMADVAPALLRALEARRQAWERDQATLEGVVARADHAEGYARFLENELGPYRTVRRYAASVLRRVGLLKPRDR